MSAFNVLSAPVEASVVRTEVYNKNSSVTVIAEENGHRVQINEIDNEYNGTYLGVVTKSPDTFDLPDTFSEPHPRALCITTDDVRIFGDSKQKKRSVLNELAEGSTVGLAVDTDRSLHLYVDGKHQGVVAPDIPTPCYFMFDMYAYCTKVTALPVTSVP